MKSRGCGELGLGAKAQVRPRSWAKILTESWPSAGPSPRVYLVKFSNSEAKVILEKVMLGSKDQDMA